MDTKPRETLFSFQNWSDVPSKLVGYTKKDYRTYVILHECGHALGLGHEGRKDFQSVPIMFQQTRGIGRSIKNLCPLKSELKKLGDE
jgi:hypothetical protein